MEAELNLDPDSNPDPESDQELIADPDPNLQIMSDPDPDATLSTGPVRHGVTTVRLQALHNSILLILHILLTLRPSRTHGSSSSISYINIQSFTFLHLFLYFHPFRLSPILRLQSQFTPSSLQILFFNFGERKVFHFILAQ